VRAIRGKQKKQGVVKLSPACAVAGNRNETGAEKPGTADVPDKYTAKINLPRGPSALRAVYGDYWGWDRQLQRANTGNLCAGGNTIIRRVRIPPF